MCLPTPLTANREPDLGPLTEATRALGEVLQAGQLVVLESTTYPGTTRERIAPLLEESGLAVGRDFQLAFSPERVDPGREDFTLRNTPKVLGGLTRGVRRAGEGALRGRLRRGARRVLPRGGRADEAAGEHLPLGQHRAGQRAGDAHRPHGDRHLGGGRRRRHQAVRVHALRARSRDGRALPAGGSLLPVLAGARVRRVDRVHRAGGEDQPADALPLRGQGPAGAERPRDAGQRRARGGARRVATSRRWETCASRPR